jgi:hypothetical protein
MQLFVTGKVLKLPLLDREERNLTRIHGRQTHFSAEDLIRLVQ